MYVTSPHGHYAEKDGSCKEINQGHKFDSYKSYVWVIRRDSNWYAYFESTAR